MQVEIQNDKLYKILEERGVIFNEIHAINEKLIELDTERKKLGFKMDRLKEKTSKIMEKINPKLEEFEIVSRIFIENNKAYYEVVNLVEEYKKELRKK
jgi:seryl-tRNA synthetase